MASPPEDGFAGPDGDRGKAGKTNAKPQNVSDNFMKKEKAIETINSLIQKLNTDSFNSMVWANRAKMDIKLIFGENSEEVMQIDKISFHSVYAKDEVSRRKLLENGKIQARQLLTEYIDHIRTQGLPSVGISFNPDEINLRSLWRIFIKLPIKQSFGLVTGFITLLVGVFWFGHYVESINSKSTILDFKRNETKSDTMSSFIFNDSSSRRNEIKNNVINQSNSPNSNAQIGTSNAKK